MVTNSSKTYKYRIFSTYSAEGYIGPCSNITDITIDSPISYKNLIEVENIIKKTLDSYGLKLTNFSIASWSEFPPDEEN